MKLIDDFKAGFGQLSPDKKRILNYSIMGFALIFLMVLVPQAIGLGKGGFDSSGVLKQFFFYVGPGLGFLIGIFFLFVIELVITKDDNIYGSSLLFNDPAETPAVPIPFFKNWFKFTLVTFIIFGALGLYSVFTKQQFFGIGALEQQFTAVDSILYNFALIPASENLGAAFFAAMGVFFWRLFCRRNKVPKWSFVVVTFVIVILAFMTYGFINHQMRYGFDEVAIQNVLMIWGIGGFLTALTGTFLTFWSLHATNNLFVDLSNFFGNDVVIKYTIIGFIVLVLLSILLLVRRKTKHR